MKSNSSVSRFQPLHSSVLDSRRPFPQRTKSDDDFRAYPFMKSDGELVATRRAGSPNTDEDSDQDDSMMDDEPAPVTSTTTVDIAPLVSLPAFHTALSFATSPFAVSPFPASPFAAAPPMQLPPLLTYSSPASVVGKTSIRHFTKSEERDEDTSRDGFAASLSLGLESPFEC